MRLPKTQTEHYNLSFPSCFIFSNHASQNPKPITEEIKYKKLTTFSSAGIHKLQGGICSIR